MIKQAIEKLLPKEDKFYSLIGQLSEQARECALHFKTFVESQDKQQRATASEAVNKCRIESKRLSAEITKELCATFITPFDREDIQDFTISLYKIIKTIKKICDRMDVHNLANRNGDFSRQTDLIVEEAHAMKDMVHELVSGHDTKRIINNVTVLHDLENKGDTVLSELMGDLFRNENDIKALILRKDVYDMLEKVIDRYRDAAATALQIVLKHS